MLTIICVLKSGGIYDASWVAKLQRAIARHLVITHRFVCLSDVEVPCERIQLLHDWPGWWSKLELFRPGVIDGPTLYLDLDNVVIGDIGALVPQPHEFAMIRNFNRPQHASSCVMWFKDRAPVSVWEKFISKSTYWMNYHRIAREGAYFGDQAFIWDALDRKAPLMDFPRTIVAHYKKDIAAARRPPAGASLVIFSGNVKPSTVNDSWLKEAWA